MNKRRNKRNPVSAICSTLGTVLLIIIIVLCLSVTLPKILGYEAYSVISGSMEPAIPIGSIVIVEKTQPSEVEEGDVIAFYGGPNSSAIITHRVIENRIVTGEFITKGDANQDKDMNPIAYNDLIGRVSFSLPIFGAIAQLLTSSIGKIIAAGVIVVAILLQFIANALDNK